MAKKITRFFKVGDILNLFIQMGCELRTAEATVHIDGDAFNVRYLFNPMDKSFVALQDLSDDDHISKWEVESWQRRLGVDIPWPS